MHILEKADQMLQQGKKHNPADIIQYSHSPSFLEEHVD